MTFAHLATDTTWAARIAAPVIRPAVFAFLDWPAGAIWASTHHKQVAISSGPDQGTFTGVGNVAAIEAPTYQASGAQLVYKVGLSSLPQQAITEASEAAAIGRRAILWLGLFDEGWANPVLRRVFTGRIISAGDFSHRRENGNWLTDASVEIANGRNPRRPLQNNHSAETVAAGDTSGLLLATVTRSQIWPN